MLIYRKRLFAKKDRRFSIRSIDEPVFTIRALGPENGGHWEQATIIINGQVKRITPQCLARWQDFPDEFVIPDTRSIASLVVGNAVPPSMVRYLLKDVPFVCFCKYLN